MPPVETYYCLWAAGSDDNVFVVEVTDPKDDLRESKEKDKEVKLWGLNGGG